MGVNAVLLVTPLRPLQLRFIIRTSLKITGWSFPNAGAAIIFSQRRCGELLKVCSGAFNMNISAAHEQRRKISNFGKYIQFLLKKVPAVVSVTKARQSDSVHTHMISAMSLLQHVGE